MRAGIRAWADSKVGIQEIVRVEIKMPQLLVGAFLANLFLLVGRGL